MSGWWILILTTDEMKKISYIFFAVIMVLTASCKKDNFNYHNGDKTGTLSFEGLSLEVSDEVHKVSTRAEAASDDYVLFLYDNTGLLVWQKTYQEVRGSASISLPAGNYSLEARSTSAEVPQAKFTAPVYGATRNFAIKAGVTTTLGSITCTLLQALVTVGYNEDFLKSVTGDGVASVELTAGYPLEYKLEYSNGNPTYDRRQGYFAVNGSDATIALIFKGSVDGKTQRMRATITNVKAQDWHIITIMKKVDASGNASFSVEIDGLVEDIELDNDVTADEQGDGNDPNAPIGDGGIELVSTGTYDITKTVTVPSSGTFPLTMTAKIPNGARKFTVDIASTNADFINSVNTVGGTTLDLINPSEAAMGVFDIVPFPHGAELSGKTEIDFDLSGAQTPLLAFKGTHTFTMNVVDNKGCRKSIPITLEVL